MVDIIHTTSELGINSFPDPVSEFLNREKLASSDLDEQIESRFTSSGLDKIEKEVLRKLIHTARTDCETETQTEPASPDERTAAQIVGTVSTFIQQREKVGLPPKSQLRENGRKIRFNVANLPNGKTLYLHYPGDKAFWDSYFDHPFDFQVFLEGYDGIGDKKTMPVHNDLFSDLWWKMKEIYSSDNPSRLLNEWRQAMAELYCGESPDKILNNRQDLDDLSVGRTPAALLYSTYWIFLQEDFNYPRPEYDGREYTYNPVEKILESSSSNFGRDTDYYGGPNDSNEYNRYHRIMSDVKNHEGKLVPNPELQSDIHSI
ncbi:hypothetical protein [Haloarchaeobius iranensis]|uniref:Uncharacterized protein n=1 Tax=Haloarchaeobius iranensis TaxID=996166 RepID=A0A1G9YF55_9EURY|nr:hypothetical protein [Haloarchaeobius iranensis]SDN07081.1 hypothetical protein SAMN05192554_1145 [Haloarchaeobius iranensis]